MGPIIRMVHPPSKRAKHSHETSPRAAGHAHAHPQPRQQPPPPPPPTDCLHPPFQDPVALLSSVESDSSSSCPPQSRSRAQSLDSEDSFEFDESFLAFDVFLAPDSIYWGPPPPVVSHPSQEAGSMLQPVSSRAPLPLTEPPSAASHVRHGQFTHRPALRHTIETNGPSSRPRVPSHQTLFASSLKGVFAFEPTLPDDEADHVSAPGLVNPFQDNAAERIPALAEPRTLELENGEVNGYIKCRWRGKRRHSQPQAPSTNTLGNSQKGPPTDWRPQHRGPGPSHGAEPASSTSSLTTLSTETSHSVTSTPLASNLLVDPRFLVAGNIQRLPHHFALDLRLSPADWNLFAFYRTAWCAGRAILDSSNCWLVNIAQMADGSRAVLQAILALASTYVLDYVADERVRLRSNNHYRKAVQYLTDELQNEEEQKTGGGESMVAAIALLNMVDVVSPEYRRSKKEVPRWLEGGEIACKVLEATDPGHRYWVASNVQISNARAANAIITSRAVILALLMTPLDTASSNSKRFQWVLSQSSEEDSRKVHGACGCAPRLLHRFSLITHIAAQIDEEPDSILLPIAAEYVANELANFRQWSDLTPEGYSSTDELLAACDQRLNADGAVTDKAGMTDLTAEAWRQAAIIYLECRLMRLPPSHPKVIARMTNLADCISRMPTSGPLFTAQAPFLPVFLLGLLAVLPEHELCAESWFGLVMQTSCRSSVPPAYEALQRIRVWFHDTYEDNGTDIPEEIAERYAWWEVMVARVIEEEGILCLM